MLFVLSVFCPTIASAARRCPPKVTAGERYFVFCGHGWRAAKPRPLDARLGPILDFLSDYFLNFTAFQTPKERVGYKARINFFCFYAFAINCTTIVKVNLLAYLYNYNDVVEKHTLWERGNLTCEGT